MKKLLLLLVIFLLVGCSKKEETLQVKILDHKKEYATDVYVIENSAIEQTGYQDLTRFKDYLLSSYHTYDREVKQMLYKVRLISVVDGSIYKEIILEEFEEPTLYENDQYICVKDAMTGRIILLDEELNTVNEIENMSYATYMNKDASLLYHFNSQEGIQVQDVKTNEIKTIYEQYTFINVINSSDTELVISYFNTETLLDEYGLFDLDKQTITKYETKYSYSQFDYGHNTYIGQLLPFDNTYMINNQYFTLDHTYPSIEMQDNECFSVEYMNNDQVIIDLYDFKGNHLSKAVIKDGITPPVSQLIYFEEINGYFFTLPNANGNDQLYYWQINPLNDYQLEIKEIDHLSNEKVDETIHNQIKDIKNKYGINLYVGNNGQDGFYDYDVVKEVNNKDLKNAIKIVEEALSLYPDGFIEQLGYSNYYQVDVYLVDQIEYSDANNEYDNGNVIGFTQVGDGAYNIVLEATYELLGPTLHHELCHIIDDKIKFAKRYDESLENYESDWELLNPEGFVYPDRYNDLPGYIYNDEYTPYFIDHYSMTFQKEDKARIFEYIMSGEKEYFESQYLKAKLEYFSQYIRKVFDLPEDVLWEDL